MGLPRSLSGSLCLAAKEAEDTDLGPGKFVGKENYLENFLVGQDQALIDRRHNTDAKSTWDWLWPPAVPTPPLAGRKCSSQPCPNSLAWPENC